MGHTRLGQVREGTTGKARPEGPASTAQARMDKNEVYESTDPRSASQVSFQILSNDS